MLDFLNLALSQKETPDENYAREVQELFTVGKRPFAQFTEKDVREIARALVGGPMITKNWYLVKGLNHMSFLKTITMTLETKRFLLFTITKP